MRVGDPIEATATNLRGLMMQHTGDFVVRDAGVMTAVASYRLSRRCDVYKERLTRQLRRNLGQPERETQ